MSLSERAARGPAPVVHGHPCSVGEVHAKLAPEEAAALDLMLTDRSWTAGQIFEALGAEGHVVGRQTVARHRGRKCRCYTEET